jgi:hypothetical protein
MSDGDFLQQFEQSIANLSKINAAIEHNTKSKDAFIKVVNDGLNEINTKIRGLGTAIGKMKNDLNNLQKQVDTNTSSIGTSANEKQQLQSQIATLQSEKDQLTAQLQKQKEESDAKILELQKKIDSDEATLAQITADNNNLTEQVETLNKELSGKGDTQQQHATEIQNLTDQNLKALKDQQAVNDAKIAKLTAEIEDNDAHVHEILDNTNKQARNLANELLKCEATEKTHQAQVQQLNTRIDQLTEQNQMLTAKIKSATTAINESVARLNELTDDVANAKNMDDVKKLFQEINETIDKINLTLQEQPGDSGAGNPGAGSVVSGMLAAVTGTATEPVPAPPEPTPSPPVPPAPGPLPPEQPAVSSYKQKIPPDTVFQIRNSQDGKIEMTNMSYQELMAKLQEKKLGSRGKNEQAFAKFNKLINDISKAINDTETEPVESTIQAVQKVLDANMVMMKNGNLMGGKKHRTRKRNKKGGYTYKNHKKSSSSYNSSRGRRRRRSVKSMSV